MNLPPGLPSLDESQLQQLLDLDEGKSSLLREMAALFKAETPRRLRAIREGLDAGSAAQVMEAAHALKGAAGLMGAQVAFTLARELEIKAKTESLPSPEISMEAWSKLSQAVVDAQDAIDIFLSKTTA
jgi:HPt (histidine-containing phosphotransfer) domain-containing protein